MKLGLRITQRLLINNFPPQNPYLCQFICHLSRKAQIMQVSDITDFIESIAPLYLQESFDNSGLIIGGPEKKMNGALFCLDVTESVIEEAIEKGCDLVVAHHPLIFGGLYGLNGKNHVEKTVLKAAKHDIAVYAAHTNLDNASTGVNAEIAKKLGLHDYRILRPMKGGLKKLVTFCPNMDADSGEYYPGIIRQALFTEGAGKIGYYDQTSFNAQGKGTFKAPETSQPFVGEKERMHVQDEIRIETVFPAYLQSRIIETLKSVHPYEEVAYDVYTLDNAFTPTGSGMIGYLEEPMEASTFLEMTKETMKTSCIRHTALNEQKIQKIAVCGGAGRFLLKDAIKEGADAFVTSDFKYHDFFDVEDQLLLADIGHYESEQFTIDLLYSWVKNNFPNFDLYKTDVNTNPIHYL